MADLPVPASFPAPGALGAPGHSLAPQQAWGPPAAAPPSGGAASIVRRSLSALNRYKWLCLGIVAAGTVAGIAASRFISPSYVVQGRIMLVGTSDPVEGQRSGPIRATPLLTKSSWLELLRSAAVSDSVVAKLALYVRPAQERDSAVFRDFELGERLRVGSYALAVDGAGRYSLRDATTKQVVESGRAGDSIGRKLGFLWAPSTAVLGRDRTIDFRVTTPREAAIDLGSHLQATIPEEATFMLLTLDGKESGRTANALNVWMDEFVKIATAFKRRNLTEFANTLQAQLKTASDSLNLRFGEYQNTRVNNITQPGDQAPVVIGAGGQVDVVDPAFGDYFRQKSELDAARHDRAVIDAALRSSPDAMVQSLVTTPSVALGAGGAALRAAIDEITPLQAKLRNLRLTYTDDAKAVQDVAQQLQVLQTRTIPGLARQLSQNLARQERDLGGRIATRSQQLRDIPARTGEEQRRKSAYTLQQELYNDLAARYQQAKLAEAAATPDVAILDRAVAPLLPATNTAPRIIFLALAASIGAALLVALGLDRLDKRFRYPEQVTEELNLDIIGAVPALKSTNVEELSFEDASQMVEAFRSIRLNVRYAIGETGPVMFTITSPGIGDGKSLVSCNLAMSFAEAGYRTLLIDGDIRRGQLHTTFNARQRPGLVDHLAGGAELDDIIVPTPFDRLFLLPSGSRYRKGPELLQSAAMNGVLEDMRHRYDAIIVDSAPLAAGIDTYALAAATGNMVVVMRAGSTDRKLAQAKLTLVDRLPVRIIGAVLNGVPMAGAYEYYSYLDAYALRPDDERAPARLTAG